MTDWFEFWVVTLLGAVTVAGLVMIGMEGFMSVRVVVGFAIAWSGIMYLVRDWGV